jgi:hypothetical protein
MAQRLARGAHNSEVTRSKRVAGILQFSSFTEAIHRTIATFKPLSWRAAYRRINPRQSHVRTFDGYLFLIKRQASDRHRRVVQTGMAQRERAVSLCGLITPRTYDRNILPVFFIRTFILFIDYTLHILFIP